MKTLLAFFLLSIFIQQDNDTKVALNQLENSPLPYECTRDEWHFFKTLSKSARDGIDFYYHRDVALTIKEKLTRNEVFMLKKFEQPNFTLLAVIANLMMEGRTQWLITYDKQYQIVDTLVCGIHFLDGKDRLTLRQWRINENCEVQVCFVKLDDTDPQVTDISVHAKIYFEKPVKGQRTDTFYQFTDDGHFKKLREVKYKPQMYSSQYLSTEDLWNGKEEKL